MLILYSCINESNDNSLTKEGKISIVLYSTYAGFFKSDVGVKDIEGRENVIWVGTQNTHIKVINGDMYNGISAVYLCNVVIIFQRLYQGSFYHQIIVGLI